MKEVVIARVVHNLLNGCGSYCDVRSVGRRVQIILYVRVLFMSVRGTFVQGMINIIWRKYVHRYAPYIRKIPHHWLEYRYLDRYNQRKSTEIDTEESFTCVSCQLQCLSWYIC